MPSRSPNYNSGSAAATAAVNGNGGAAAAAASALASANMDATHKVIFSNQDEFPASKTKQEATKYETMFSNRYLLQCQHVQTETSELMKKGQALHDAIVAASKPTAGNAVNSWHEESNGTNGSAANAFKTLTEDKLKKKIEDDKQEKGLFGKLASAALDVGGLLAEKAKNKAKSEIMKEANLLQSDVSNFENGMMNTVGAYINKKANEGIHGYGTSWLINKYNNSKNYVNKVIGDFLTGIVKATQDKLGMSGSAVNSYTKVDTPQTASSVEGNTIKKQAESASSVNSVVKANADDTEKVSIAAKKTSAPAAASTVKSMVTIPGASAGASVSSNEKISAEASGSPINAISKKAAADIAKVIITVKKLQESTNGGYGGTKQTERGGSLLNNDTMKSAIASIMEILRTNANILNDAGVASAFTVRGFQSMGLPLSTFIINNYMQTGGAADAFKDYDALSKVDLTIEDIKNVENLINTNSALGLDEAQVEAINKIFKVTQETLTLAKARGEVPTGSPLSEPTPDTLMEKLVATQATIDAYNKKYSKDYPSIVRLDKILNNEDIAKLDDSVLKVLQNNAIDKSNDALVKASTQYALAYMAKDSLRRNGTEMVEPAVSAITVALVNEEELTSYDVASIMDATKSTPDIYQFMVDLLTYSNTGRGLMDKVNGNASTIGAYTPSALLKKLIYSGYMTSWLDGKKPEITNKLNLVTGPSTKTWSNIYTGGDSTSRELKKLVYDVFMKKNMTLPDMYNGKYGESSFNPTKLWDTLRDPGKNGKPYYGENALVSSYRVNHIRSAYEADLFQNGYFHLFFIKPDLNLTPNVCSAMDYYGNPLLGDVITNLNYANTNLYPSWGNLFPAVQYDYSGANQYISYVLSNFIKGTSINDISLDTKDAWESVFGMKMSYGLTHRKSTIGQDISITFHDTKKLLIMNIIQAWVKYISAMKESVGNVRQKFQNFGKMDYYGALYGFITEPDGCSIVHWFRYIGMYPTTVPWSTLSLSGGNSGEVPEFSVSFKTQFYDTNDPCVLLDFNYIMNNFGDKSYEERAKINDTTEDKFTSGIHGVSNLYGGPTITENRCNVVRVVDDNGGNFKFALKFFSDDTSSTIM